MIRIKKRDLWAVFFRSFFIQASWNFERMLALGFCFCLLPVARRLCGSRDERVEFLRRHLEFFNAHPCTANWALGAISKLEEQAYTQKWPDRDPIGIFKNRLCGPLGAIGDRLFWNLIKPLAAILGVVIALIYGAIGVPVFLLLYNIPHLYFRIRGVFRGYQQGFDVVRGMSVRRYGKYFNLLTNLGAASIGLLIIVGGRWSFCHGGETLAAFGIALGVSFILIRRKFPIAVVLILVMGAAFFVGLLLTQLGDLAL